MGLKSSILCLLVAIGTPCITAECISDKPAYDSLAVCTSPTTFVFTNGKIITEDAVEIKCPEKQFCIGMPDVCSAVGTPACTPVPCNQCNQVGKFVCVNETHFGLCTANSGAPLFTQPCLSGQVCGAPESEDGWPCVYGDYKSQCREEQATGNPTETTVTTEKPTTPGTIDPCNNQSGTFPVTSDSQCKRYIYCYKDGTNMKYVEYTCPDSYIFNWSTRRCVSARSYPQLCATQFSS